MLGTTNNWSRFERAGTFNSAERAENSEPVRLPFHPELSRSAFKSSLPTIAPAPSKKRTVTCA
jgi:hypothetical protein